MPHNISTIDLLVKRLAMLAPVLEAAQKSQGVDGDAPQPVLDLLLGPRVIGDLEQRVALGRRVRFTG